jgi:hypothetical protein
VYTYRDVWPLITFTLDPADGDEGHLVWTKVALAGIAGFLVPMCEPYPYLPVDPEASLLHVSSALANDYQIRQHPQTQISPEQTASLLSFFTFSFVDSVIAASRRVTHLSYAMLPPQVDRDMMRTLRPRSYRYLDPFATRRRKVNVTLALLRSFATSWAAQAVVIRCAVRMECSSLTILLLMESSGCGCTWFANRDKPTS